MLPNPTHLSMGVNDGLCLIFIDNAFNWNVVIKLVTGLGRSKLLIGKISFYRFIYVYLIFLNLRKFCDFYFIVDKVVIEMWLRSCNCIQCNVWDRHMACSWIWKDNVHHSPKNRAIAHENAEEIWLVHSPLSQDKTTELTLMSIMLN